jgi:transcriptional regulator with XRE-family HTH domain
MNKFQAAIQRLKDKSKQKTELASVDGQWTQERLKELNLTRADLVKDLMLDSSTISLVMSGVRKMVRTMKGAIYYYLAYKEITGAKPLPIDEMINYLQEEKAKGETHI